MRLAREMCDLALDLARAAAARAKRDLAADADTKPVAETVKPAPRTVPDASTLFTRLCRIIETSIALEARLAKGLIPAIPKPRPAPAASPQTPANTIPRPQPSQQAAALSASTSLAAPAIPPWQPKQPGPFPVVSAPPSTGLPKAGLNGTKPG